MSARAPRRDTLNAFEEQTVRRALLRMRAHGVAVAMGLLCGLGLFLATNILVLRGGPVVGPHLGLLAVYFPGYQVTFIGSFIGFAYASLLGYLIGLMIASLYNWLVDR
jgi:hypothetical protein